MKISLKLGLWFFVCIILIETISMLYLHNQVIHSRVNQELQSLKARGNSHRDVLEISFNDSTLNHIGLMESHTDTEVVITNKNGKVLLSSGPVSESIDKILHKPIGKLNRNGKIIQADWRKEHFISTVTNFKVDDGNQGYVYMFKNTNDVRRLISQLNRHFIFASILILLFMLITIFFLSRALTKPLISMKEATKKISKGDFSVTLPPPSKDELGELSRSIQTLANDLNYLKKERNEFLASISHELRTPITYVKGYSDIAKRKGLTEAERVYYLEIIHEEAARINMLLEELFDFAKLDQNTFTITKEKVHLSSYLQSIYEKVLPAYQNKGIQLLLKCQESIFIEIDPTRFEQVLMNLLDNALKYSNNPATTHIKAFIKNREVHISICDQGIGIPQTDLPYIFDRLYRVDKSRSRASGGFGIGLAIVKELVEDHCGDILVKSEVGKGSCFTIVLKENFR